MTLRQSWARAQSSLLTRWRPRSAAGRAATGAPGSPSILVIGACQGQAIARVSRLLLPESGVETLPLHRLRARFPRMADLVRFARGFDAVFAYAFTTGFADGGTFETLRAETRLFTVPPIVFAAFHPDSIYVGPLDRPELTALVSGPMGHYHSALALFAWLEGIPVEGALRLFDAEIYRALGYLDAWSDAAAGLLTLGRHAGHPLEDDLARWTRRGAFMHSMNHPKLFVLGDVARGLLRRAGFAPAGIDLDSYMAYTLIENGTWPIYPAVGAFYGVPGSDLFLRPASRRTGPAATMTREAFLRESYRGYATVGRERLVNDRVARWREDGAIRALLTETARR